MEINNIFDAIIKLSHASIIRTRHQNKLTQLKSVQAKRCGNCEHWMKSSCKPEKKYNQFKHVDSYGCKDFARTHISGFLIEKFKKELYEIETEANDPPYQEQALHPLSNHKGGIR